MKFSDADSFRVEALTPGCQFIYGGEMHTIQRVQPGPRTPRTTYLITDEAETATACVCSDGSLLNHQPYRTFAFATGTWIKGFA